MKKMLLIGLAAVALLFWVATWFRTPEAVATAASQPWPAGGGLDHIAARFPPLQANAAARKLEALGTALPKNEAIEDFVGREMSRAELAVGVPPPAPDVTAIRELLLHEPVIWARAHVEVGDKAMTDLRAMQLTMARALIANALVKARANDAAAWEDLHAVWTLARTLDGQPVMMMQTAALTMSRMVNALAWKMPLPAPAWLAEVQERDALRPLLESFQYQSASYWEDSAIMFPTKWLANAVEHDRLIAESLAKETRCDVETPMNELGVDLSFVWRRALRYRAEREATANALRVREGKAIETKSRCSDGAWAFDGKTLRFSRPIATAPPDRPMSLTLSVAP